MMHTTANCEAFVGSCVKELLHNGVCVEFVKCDSNDELTYSFFEGGNSPKMCIKYFFNGFKENVDIILHEYCHFLQWKADTKLYKSYQYAYPTYMRWLNGLPNGSTLQVSRAVLLEHLRTIQSLELDCDKRAIRLIKKHKLEIDIDRYIRTSNSYILSYNYTYTERKDFNFWPHHLPKLLDMVPKKHLTVSQLELIIPEHKEFFLKNCK